MRVIQGGSSGTGACGPTKQTDDKRPIAARKSYSVLFVCPDNSIRSILAEAVLKGRGGKDFNSFSAGTQPAGDVHPLAKDLLKEFRLWHDGLKSKGCDQFLGPDAQPMDYVISVGERPPAGLPPAWPGQPRVIHWRITDPIMDRKPAENERSMRKSLGELETRIKLFVLVHERESHRPRAAAA
jgi:arsenate reductase (thioredoxin)